MQDTFWLPFELLAEKVVSCFSSLHVSLVLLKKNRRAFLKVFLHKYIEPYVFAKD